MKLRRGEDNDLTLRVVAPSRLSLAPLFGDPGRQAGLRVSVPDGWSARYDEAIAAWELQSPVPTPGDIRFGGVRPEMPAGHALVTMVAAGRRTTISVDVLPEAVPRERALADVLTAELNPREVAISRRIDQPERTNLTLTLTNRGDTPLVTRPWGPWPPTLTLVFPTAELAPGDGALTSARRLDDVEVAIERGTGWRVVKRRPGPEWDIVAVPVGGRRDVLGPGAEVEVAIRGLSTDFVPGPAEVELHSYGFPGFADGIRTFSVEKRALPCASPSR